MATKYNRGMVLSPVNVVMRCIEETFAPSKSSNNPMITLTLEVQHPEVVEIDGEEVTIAGEKITTYYTTKTLSGGVVDEAKQAKNVKRLEELYKLFGLDDSNINVENPVLAFKGKLVHARIYTKSREMFNAPTAAEKAEGKTVGEKMLNPVTGQPVTQNQLQIAEIYGLAEEKGSL